MNLIIKDNALPEYVPYLGLHWIPVFYFRNDTCKKRWYEFKIESSKRNTNKLKCVFYIVISHDRENAHTINLFTVKVIPHVAGRSLSNLDNLILLSLDQEANRQFLCLLGHKSLYLVLMNMIYNLLPPKNNINMSENFQDIPEFRILRLTFYRWKVSLKMLK